MIIGGDFNQLGNPELDSQSKFSNTRLILKSQLAIDVLDEELGLTDIWRLLHPQQREYCHSLQNEDPNAGDWRQQDEPKKVF